MKKYMVALLMLGAVIGYAAENITETEMVKIQKALPNYKMALKSENVGVRQSALYQLAQLKSRYPSIDLAYFQSTLRTLESRDKDVLVRINAGLTRWYLNDKLVVETVKADDPASSVQFYNQVHEMLFASVTTQK